MHDSKDKLGDECKTPRGCLKTDGKWCNKISGCLKTISKDLKIFDAEKWGGECRSSRERKRKKD